MFGKSLSYGFFKTPSVDFMTYFLKLKKKNYKSKSSLTDTNDKIFLYYFAFGNLQRLQNQQCQSFDILKFGLFLYFTILIIVQVFLNVFNVCIYFIFYLNFGL